MPCPKCGSEKLLYSDTWGDPFSTFPVPIETAYGTVTCGQCGTQRGTSGMQEVDLVRAVWLFRLGAVTAFSFQQMRTSLGFKAQDLARLLQVRPETISHWEHEKGPVDRAAWATLGAMVEDCIASKTTVFERLLKALKPDVPKQAVKLEAPMYDEERRYPGEEELPSVRMVRRQRRRILRRRST